ncbi:MAG: glycosyl hydrolase family 95 catalytic domain-containing protein [Limisphaerales bacterium]
MKRRDFLKTGAVAAGLAGFMPPLMADETNPLTPSEQKGAPELSADYLRRAQSDQFLPKPPELAGVTISPMPLAERIRRKIVPRRGFCSIAPGNDVLISGNGAMSIELDGHPYTEQIPFRHEMLYVPHRRPAEAPNIADILPQVRQMLLDGKNHDAAALAYHKWHANPIPGGGMGSGGGAGFSVRLEFPKGASVKDYLRTVDFESTEVKVHWTDERGEWVRQTFSSRPDNLVVQWLTAPKGQSVNVRITVAAGGGGRGRFGGGGGGGGTPGGGGGSGNAQTDFNEQRLIYKGRLDPSVNNRGYAGVTRVVRDGGSARMEGNTLVIENASSVMLLTRIDYFPDYSEDQVEATRQSLEQLTPDYPALLERARKVQSEMLNRVTVDFGGASKYGLSSEELLSDQQSSPGYSGAFLEKLFDMCRYWFIFTSGKYCSMSAETNANINLQLAPMALGYHREGEEAYFNWMESLVPDFHTNAKNIFGMRGAKYSLTPGKEWGVETAFDHAGSTETGETWPHPYWLSDGPWCVRPFWDHYLVTGDLDFLRNRVVPAYKDLALFYEDFLTVTDPDGNYIFVPSFSPENNPGNLNPSCMLSVNASMDIAGCREVLGNLVESCERLGIEADSVPKWRAMLAKLPPYLLEPDGAMKEWAWPTLTDRYVHRHISHLYGAWPGDEIDPDRTPQLAKAALIADRHRIPERLAAHGRCHRALVGARLKDSYLVDSELRQLIEEGYVGPTLRCSHDPYSFQIPDAQGGIPTIMMEMLAYSRPGVIEVLPALPPSLVKGSMNGMLLRTFARLDKLAWDMEARTVDLTVTSVRKQDVTLIARHGIEEISAPDGVLAAQPTADSATCDLHLPEGKPVEIHLKLGRRNPLDWVNWVA